MPRNQLPALAFQSTSSPRTSPFSAPTLGFLSDDRTNLLVHVRSASIRTGGAYGHSHGPRAPSLLVLALFLATSPRSSRGPPNSREAPPNSTHHQTQRTQDQRSQGARRLSADPGRFYRWRFLPSPRSLSVPQLTRGDAPLFPDETRHTAPLGRSSCLAVSLRRVSLRRLHPQQSRPCLPLSRSYLLDVQLCRSLLRKRSAT